MKKSLNLSVEKNGDIWVVSDGTRAIDDMDLVTAIARLVDPDADVLLGRAEMQVESDLNIDEARELWQKALLRLIRVDACSAPDSIIVDMYESIGTALERYLEVRRDERERQQDME